MGGENYSTWIYFHAETAGLIGFTISPNNEDGGLNLTGSWDNVSNTYTTTTTHPPILIDQQAASPIAAGTSAAIHTTGSAGFNWTQALLEDTTAADSISIHCAFINKTGQMNWMGNESHYQIMLPTASIAGTHFRQYYVFAALQ